VEERALVTCGSLDTIVHELLLCEIQEAVPRAEDSCFLEFSILDSDKGHECPLVAARFALVTDFGALFREFGQVYKDFFKLFSKRPDSFPWW
jgi:hypothetical protein